MALNVKLVKSLNGRKKDQIATAHSLGLRKIGQSVEHVLTPSIQGMINAVADMVKVEEI